mmetsp:Transcript_4991/g.6890  ORF Transcript_4991/g.6890 Transcript_4991/m.6890 type:complete len:569 (+) Transcript_4991:23-1729(+)
MKKSKAAMATNKKAPTIPKKIAVGDLLSATQDILKVDPLEKKSSSTLFLYGAKIDHKSPNNSDSEDFDDISLNSSSRSQYWNGRYAKASSDTYSLHSSESANTLNSRFLTPKEMVKDISLRVERHQAPPDYVLRIDELSPQLLSWNNKLSERLQNRRSGLSLPINIIGCHQPVELLLAKANCRQRHERKVRQLKEIKMEEKVKEIGDSIKNKFSRAERYAAILEEKQRQVSWLKLMKVLLYVQKAGSLIRHRMDIHDKFKAVTSYAFMIRNVCLKWYYKTMYLKYKLGFLRSLGGAEFPFRLKFRIWRKRRAVQRIHAFIINHSNMKKRANVIIHNFLVSVRVVQRCIRNFLSCKEAKLMALSKIWLRMEAKYVSKMLKKREAQKKRNTVADSKVDFDFFDAKTKVEMKNQAKKWSQIDAQMEEQILRLKVRRIIIKESDEEIVQHLMLPEKVRIQKLKTFLNGVRREFYGNQKVIIRKRVDLLSNATFHESHASDLLKGKNLDYLNTLILERCVKKVPIMKFQPFLFFSSVDHKLIYNLVEGAHREFETFAIKTEVSMHGKQRNMRS